MPPAETTPSPEPRCAAVDTVMTCPPALRREAIMQLAAAGDTAGRRELAQAVDDHLTDPRHDWSGLLVAMSGARPDAAAWVQPLPGNMAQLWPPRIDHDNPADVSALLKAARGVVQRRGASLCQTAVAGDDNAAAVALTAAGMTLIAPLEYLTAAVPNSPPPMASSLRLGPWSELDHAGRMRLVASVRQESMDCVALRDVLDPEALLAGFAEQDDTAPAHWSAVYLDGREPASPAGVLLLAPRPEVNGMELLLMGLAPEARGRGLGRAVLDAAFARAHAAGARRLLLSVDTTNTPACRLYARAGFVGYARQDVYAWLKRPS